MSILSAQRRPVSAALALALSIGAFGAVAVATPASAATLTVTSSADSGAGSLRDVIAAASAGDTIQFAGSVTAIALASTIPITVGLTIQGPGSDLLTISKANSSNFIMLSFEPDIVDQDFTVEGVGFDGTGGGTGIAMYAGLSGDESVRDVTLRDVRVANNIGALGSAFATFQMAGNLLVEDSIFEDNSALFDGGVFSLEFFFGTATIVDSTFTRNTAGTSVAGGNGGAISFNTSIEDVNDLTIENSTFTDNAADRGGAVWIANTPDGTLADVRTSTFTGNTAIEGGAIAVDTATGGFQVNSSTFTGNSAEDAGTSIWIEVIEGLAGMQNSTIDESDVPAQSPAAIFFYQAIGGFFISHTTIVAPVALYVDDNGGDLLGIENSILDVSDAAAIIVNTGDPVVARYNAFSTAGATDNIDDVVGNLFSVDPLLAPLADNGGPTATRLPAAGSPVINVGDPAVTTNPAFDQRGDGFVRVIGGRVDIGAVEAEEPTLAATGLALPGWVLVMGLIALLAGAVALRIGRRQTA